MKTKRKTKGAKPNRQRRFAEARGYTALADRNADELKVLIECDEKLEALQDYRRGDTNLKALRETIREMIKEREAKPQNAAGELRLPDSDQRKETK